MADRKEKEIVFTTKLNNRMLKLGSLRNSLDKVGNASRRALAPIRNMPNSLKFAASIVSTAAIGAAIKSTSDFNSELIKVRALAKGTRKELDGLSGFALDTAKITQFTPTQVLQMAKFQQMAGWNKIETIKQATLPMIDLAGAARVNSDISPDRVTDHATNIMTAFNMPAKMMREVADKFTYAFTHSNQNFEEFGMAMRNFAPMAYASGISFDESIALTMSLANSGIKETIAGTALNSSAVRLFTLPPKVVKALKKNFTRKELSSFMEEDGVFKKEGFTNFFKLMKDNNVSVGDQMKILGKEGGKYLLSVIDKISSIKQIMIDLKHNSAGSAAMLNATNLQGLAGELELLKSAITATTIRFTNESGINSGITSVIKSLKEVFSVFSNLDAQQIKEITYAVSSLGIVLGTISGILGAIAAWKASAVVLGLVASALGVAALPVMPIIAGGTMAVAGVAATGVAVANWDSITNPFHKEKSPEWKPDYNAWREEDLFKQAKAKREKELDQAKNHVPTKIELTIKKGLSGIETSVFTKSPKNHDVRVLAGVE